MPALQAVVIFGGPGTGKGTQGKALGTLPGLVHVSCGDIFRSLDPKSRFGKVFNEFSSRGELVPDEVTVEIWWSHVQGMIDRKQINVTQDVILLDGIPRNPRQAKMLENYVSMRGIIHLKCDDINTMIERLYARAAKENRKDDTDEAVIRHRWEVYEEETSPVLAYYPSELIFNVDAMQLPWEVLAGTLAVLNPMLSQDSES